MLIEIYGKEGCDLCHSAWKKVNTLLEKWSMDEEVEVKFMDTDTVDGAAEADFFDVFEIPGVLVKEDKDEVIARWEGEAPSSDELQESLQQLQKSA